MKQHLQAKLRHFKISMNNRRTDSNEKVKYLNTISAYILIPNVALLK